MPASNALPVIVSLAKTFKTCRLFSPHRAHVTALFSYGFLLLTAGLSTSSILHSIADS